MNLTNQSKDLIKFFSNDSCSFPTPNEERVNTMFMQLYNDIKNGVQYVSKMKKKPVIEDEEINIVSQIPYPDTFQQVVSLLKFENT